jgi:hypothetical protein
VDGEWHCQSSNRQGGWSVLAALDVGHFYLELAGIKTQMIMVFIYVSNPDCPFA